MYIIINQHIVDVGLCGMLFKFVSTSPETESWNFRMSCPEDIWI